MKNKIRKPSGILEASNNGSASLRPVIVAFLASMALFFSEASMATIDSYRYLHVTIDTPWWIFLFLLPAVLSPFILMVVLYWRFSGRKELPKKLSEKLPREDDDQ